MSDNYMSSRTHIQGTERYVSPQRGGPPVDITFPMNPRNLVFHFGKQLHDIERMECIEYETIYYINTKVPPYIRPLKGELNQGFDNSAKELIVHVGDHIAYRYEILKELGRGSFGQVYKCFDHRDKVTVAVKVLLNKKRLLKQGLIEKRICEQL